MSASDILTLILAPIVVGVVLWSVQRIIGRIDKIGDKLETFGTRLAVVETKQDAQVEVGVQTAKVARKTATKVGVRLPKELTDTIDPRRVAHS